jgi:hypothetical protein
MATQAGGRKRNKEEKHAGVSKGHKTCTEMNGGGSS